MGGDLLDLGGDGDLLDLGGDGDLLDLVDVPLLGRGGDGDLFGLGGGGDLFDLGGDGDLLACRDLFLSLFWYSGSLLGDEFRWYLGFSLDGLWLGLSSDSACDFSLVQLLCDVFSSDELSLSRSYLGVESLLLGCDGVLGAEAAAFLFIMVLVGSSCWWMYWQSSPFSHVPKGK